MKKRVSETKICLCRDTMIKLFKHLRKTKSGMSLMKLITTRTANQFPMKKRITKGGKCRCGISLPNVKDNETPFEFCSLACKNKSKKTMRKKPRTAKQKAATRKLVAFNKKRFK